MKVLIAEDEPVSRRVLQRLLAQWDYEVVNAQNGEEAWRILQTEDAPPLAILDWEMPGMDGVAICRELRQHERGEFFYVILLTARSNTTDVVLGMEAGADDYITKPFQPEELKVRLRAGRRILDLQQELVASREKYRERALRDSLTGTFNHQAIFDMLQRELARSERDGHDIAVIMGDLDHFKHVNDTYGHRAGDEVLVEVCRRMQVLLRRYDGLGRYGGEEFLLVLSNCDSTQAQEVARRIRQDIADPPVATAAGPIDVTISLSVTSTSDGRERSADRLISAADEALYQAKRDGRNRVQVAVAHDGEQG